MLFSWLHLQDIQVGPPHHWTADPGDDTEEQVREELHLVCCLLACQTLLPLTLF